MNTPNRPFVRRWSNDNTMTHRSWQPVHLALRYSADLFGTVSKGWKQKHTWIRLRATHAFKLLLDIVRYISIRFDLHFHSVYSIRCNITEIVSNEFIPFERSCNSGTKFWTCSSSLLRWVLVNDWIMCTFDISTWLACWWSAVRKLIWPGGRRLEDPLQITWMAWLAKYLRIQLTFCTVHLNPDKATCFPTADRRELAPPG